MAFIRFEDIDVWQMSRELARNVYQVTANGLFAKDWGLKDQIQRAAVSVSSNIAEGHGRRGNREMVKFLWIAKGSASEIQSQLYIALDMTYITKEQFDKLYNDASLIQVKLYRLIQSFSSDLDRQKV